MPPKKEVDSTSLKAHGIYFQKRSALDTCPEELQPLLKQVIGIQDLKFDHFGGYEPTALNTRLPYFTPRQEYEQELKREADELHASCCDDRRPDDIEIEWVQVLKPIVFHRFDREGGREI